MNRDLTPKHKPGRAGRVFDTIMVLVATAMVLMLAVWATGAEITSAPAKIAAGEIATVEILAEKGEALEVLIRPRIPAGGHVFDVESGRLYFTATKPGRYLLILIAETPAGFTIDTATIEVTAADDPGGPIDGPDRFGLVKAAAQAIKKHLPDATGAERTKRAAWFASMADRIEADRLNSTQIVALTTAEVKTWPAPWRSIFNDLIEPIQAANLVTPTRSAAAWRDIAKGIRP